MRAEHGTGRVLELERPLDRVVGIGSAAIVSIATTALIPVAVLPASTTTAILLTATATSATWAILLMVGQSAIATIAIITSTAAIPPLRIGLLVAILLMAVLTVLIAVVHLHGGVDRAILALYVELVRQLSLVVVFPVLSAVGPVGALLLFLALVVEIFIEASLILLFISRRSAWIPRITALFIACHSTHKSQTDVLIAQIYTLRGPYYALTF